MSSPVRAQRAPQKPTGPCYKNPHEELAPPAGLEPATLGLGTLRSFLNECDKHAFYIGIMGYFCKSVIRYFYPDYIKIKKNLGLLAYLCPFSSTNLPHNTD